MYFRYRGSLKYLSSNACQKNLFTENKKLRPLYYANLAWIFRKNGCQLCQSTPNASKLQFLAKIGHKKILIFETKLELLNILLRNPYLKMVFSENSDNFGIKSGLRFANFLKLKNFYCVNTIMALFTDMKFS